MTAQPATIRQALDEERQLRRVWRIRNRHRGEAGWASVNAAGAHLYPVLGTGGMLACACLCDHCYINGACVCPKCHCRKPLVWTDRVRPRPVSLHSVSNIPTPGWPMSSSGNVGDSMEEILVDEPNYGHAQEGYTDRCRLPNLEPIPHWLEEHGIRKLAEPTMAAQQPIGRPRPAAASRAPCPRP